MTLQPGDRVAFGEGEVLWADETEALVRWRDEAALTVHPIRLLTKLPPVDLPATDADEGDWLAMMEEAPAEAEDLFPDQPEWKRRLGL